MPIGQDIVEHLKPFLLDLLHQPLADKTRVRHRDHLWMLGGEIIRRRYEDPDLARQSVKELLATLLEEDGGPLIWPRISESEQRVLRCHLQEAIPLPAAGQSPLT